VNTVCPTLHPVERIYNTSISEEMGRIASFMVFSTSCNDAHSSSAAFLSGDGERLGVYQSTFDCASTPEPLRAN
jgi:hypothetical protein